jgi:hypothetical protein
VVLPLPYAVTHPTRGVQIDGLVGAEILANFRVVIDYAAGKFTLLPFRSPPPRGITLPFLSDDGTHIYVSATIDGASGLFGLDTGDNGSVTVFGTFARKHGLYQRKGFTFFGGGVGGISFNEDYRAHQFALAGVTMANPVITVKRITSGAFASRSIAGNLGAEILSRYTLTFDFRMRTITFLPNANAHNVFCGSETGLAILPPQGPGPIDIGSLRKGTPAWEAGLRDGDKITALNGRSTRTLGLFDFGVPCPSRFTPFTLTVRRGKNTFVTTVHPRALL